MMSIVTTVRSMLLRRRIREEQARLREATQALEFYEAMKADAHRRQSAAINQLAHIQQVARLNRMARA